MVSSDRDAVNETLSAVMDGQATPADWARVNGAWATDPALRERWALWHAAGDGLRSTKLPEVHRQPEALLAALHAQLPAEASRPSRRSDWWAPLGVAASFVAVALLVGMLRPAPTVDSEVAAAPIATPRAQGLDGLSFAQTAAGRTLPDASPETIDWNLTLPEPAASQAHP